MVRYYMSKTKSMIISAAAVGTVITAAGVTAAVYNSRPMRMRRMVRRTGRAMNNVGEMLTHLSQMTQM